jgi:hypothetical protein
VNEGSGILGEHEQAWRRQASCVVEELFAATQPGEWDGLLELREGLLTGADWGVVLENFLACRWRLERDHYLPFYRLRRLLEVHLRLETRGGTPAGRAFTSELSLWRHRGMDDLRRRAQREHCECDLAVAAPTGVAVAVVERPLV